MVNNKSFSTVRGKNSKSGFQEHVGRVAHAIAGKQGDELADAVVVDVEIEAFPNHA